VSVRLRFAPSPTGALHIGSVRTFLYNYLFARQRGGTLILRVEDTDQDRLVPGAIDSIYDGLHWLGISWAEGPREGGPHAPYVQSERLPLYQKKAQELVDKGAAYYCFCSKERLAAMRAQQQARKELTRYDRHCRSIPVAEAAERAKTEPHVVRLKVPDEGTLAIDDLVHGRIEWQANTIEDQVVLKSDGFPTYHLAVVIDDRVMEVTHILRGEEWIASIPKHLLIYRAFGWDVPPMAHFPDVLGPDGKKLSKRHGSTAVSQFRDDGYLPEALINYLSLIGWAPGTEDEVFSMDDLVRVWKIEQVQKAGGKWDKERLNYFNGVWIRRLSVDELVRRLRPFVPAEWDEEMLRAIAPHIQERMKTLTDAKEQIAFLFTDELSYDKALLVPKKSDTRATGEALSKAAAVLRDTNPFTAAQLRHALETVADEIRWTIRDLTIAVRFAVTGRNPGPPLYESLELLGRERAVARVERAIEQLASEEVRREAIGPARRRFIARFTIRPGKPMVLEQQQQPSAETVDEGDREAFERIGQTLKAYREAAKRLLAEKYPLLRPVAPTHMRIDCDCLAILCDDGIVVRWEQASGDKPLVRSGRLIGDENKVSSVAPKFSEGYIYVPPDPASFELPAEGPRIQLAKTDAEGRSSPISDMRVGIVVALDKRDGTDQDRPIPIASIMNEFVFQLFGEEFDASAAFEPGKGQPFVAVSRIRLGIGWETFQIYPPYDPAVWDASKAPQWAELDLLAAATERNLADQHFFNIDPRASARRQFASLLQKFRALLDGPEAPVQEFLKANPALLSPTHTKVWPKLRLGDRATDFVFREPTDEYVLVEIEAPLRKLFREDGQQREELTHAVKQIADWIRYIQDNLATVQRELELTSISTNPRALIVIGRSTDLTPADRRTLITFESMHPRIRIMTYDDLFQTAQRTVENILGTLPDPRTTAEIYYVTR
jgi:glutamyl-tRNA synthetase